MRRSWRNIAFLTGIAAFAPAGLPAQLPKTAPQKPGSLTGEVVTAKGSPVSGAQILWQTADGGIPHVLHTDAHGRFHLESLRAGLYDVRASADGSWSEWEHNVTIRPGSEANVKLRLAFKAPVPAKAVALRGTIHTWDLPVLGAAASDPAVDPKGNIWLTLAETGHLARFNPDKNEWKLFKVPTSKSRPQGLVSDAGGNIWFTENAVGKIGRVDAATGSIAEYSIPSSKDPQTLAFGSDGALWFTSQNSNLIGRMDIATGKFIEFSVPTQNSKPSGIVAAGDGGLWFCEFAGKKLGRVDPVTEAITEYVPEEVNVQPRRLAAVPGAIYFTDGKGGRLGRLTLADMKFKFWDSPSGENSEPDGIAADTAGMIWYVESAPTANKLVRFNPDVEVLNTFPMPAPDSAVPNIARDARGRLWMPLATANQIMSVE